MYLTTDIRQFFAWFFRVLRVFMRVRPATTISLILFSMLAKITAILAFFLPLKVVLLAGSSGVPRYFRAFVDPAYREEWIVGLAAAAVIAYVLTLSFEALSKKLATMGSLDVLEGANDIPVMQDQRGQAQSYYSRFSTVAAELLFALVLSALIPVLDRNLGIAYSASLLLALLATMLIVGRRQSQGGYTGLGRRLADSPRGYLGLVSAIIFFIGFFTLLIPFVLGEDKNILLAILSILALRQLLGALTAAIADSVKLVGERFQINPLLFPEHQIRKIDRQQDRKLREVFSRKQRLELVGDTLSQLGIAADNLSVRWRDPVTPNINLFDVRYDAEGVEKTNAQLQVFSEKTIHQLENEQFLLDQVGHDTLLAPSVMACREVDGFTVALKAMGAGKPLVPKQYAEVVQQIREAIWCVAPPDALVRAFHRSKQSIYDRLDDELVARMEVAVDSNSDTDAFDRIQAVIGRIREYLSDMPLSIVNNDLKPRVIVPDGKSGYLVMNWGRWSVEPMGAGIQGEIQVSGFGGCIDRLQRSRSDLDDLAIDSLELAQKCSVLEKTLLQGRFRESLNLVPEILSLHEKTINK